MKFLPLQREKLEENDSSPSAVRACCYDRLSRNNKMQSDAKIFLIIKKMYFLDYFNVKFLSFASSEFYLSALYLFHDSL